jgi:MFS family permease
VSVRFTHLPVWLGSLGRGKSTVFALLFLLMSIGQTLLLTTVPLQAFALLGSARSVSLFYFAIGVVSLAARMGIPWLARVIRRRGVFTLGAVCFAIGASLLALHQPHALMVGLVSNVFGLACIEISINLYVLDHIPRQELGRFEPKRIFFAAWPWMVCPWLGVRLEQHVAIWLPYVLAAVAVFVLLAFFWFLRLTENVAVSPMRQKPPSPLRYLPRFFAQPRLRLAWALALGRASWWSMFFIYAPIFAVTSGLGKEAGGIIVSIATGCVLLVPLWGWLGRHFGLRALLLGGYGACGLLSLAAAVALGDPWLGAVTLVLAALCAGTIDGAGNLLFLRAVHPHERAEMTTVFITYRDIAQLAPPGLCSILLALFSLPVVFAASGGLMLAMASLTRHISRRL